MATTDEVLAYARGNLGTWEPEEVQAALDVAAELILDGYTIPVPTPARANEALLRSAVLILLHRAKLSEGDSGAGDGEIPFMPAKDPLVRYLLAPYRKVRMGL